MLHFSYAYLGGKQKRRSEGRRNNENATVPIKIRTLVITKLHSVRYFMALSLVLELKRQNYRCA